MRQSPNSNPQNNQERESDRNKSSSWKRKILLGSGCILLIGIGGGLIYSWYFVQFQLAELVEKQVNENVFAKRKIKIGKLTSFSPNTITFGASEIVKDEKYLTHATVKSVRVAYNIDPIKLLFQRTFKLNLDINLLDAKLHLEQIEQEREYIWDISVLQLKENPPPEGFIKYEINLAEIEVENIQFELVGKTLKGAAKKTVAGTIKSAIVNSADSKFLTDAKSIAFKAEEGKLTSGGTLQAAGNFSIPEEKIEVEIAAAKVPANTLNRILALPFQLEAGKLSTPGFQIIATKGVVDALNGVGKIEDVTMRLAQLPRPFTKGNGQVKFSGNKIELENITGFLGAIPAAANGSLTIPLDPQNLDRSETGYNIKATTKPITIMQLLNAFKLPKLPVAVSGKVQANLEVIGEIENPEIIIDANNVGLIGVDRVKFNSLDADIEVKNAFLYLTQLNATPLVGGTVTGTGKTQLEGDNLFQIQLQAKDVSADAIALEYTENLPLVLGLADGAANVSGAFANNKATVTANIAMAGGNIKISNFEVRKDNWSGDVLVSEFKIYNQQIGDIGRLNTAFNISGSDYSFETNSITAIADYATVNMTQGGQIIAEKFEFVRGNWSSNLRADNLRLENINILESVSGQLNLTGSLNGWNVNELNADGSGSLFLGAGNLNIEKLQVNKGKFDTTITADRIDLDRFNLSDRFNNILRGSLNGKIALSGNLNDLNPAAIAANGELNFTRGIAIVENNLNTIFNWNGRRLEIKKAEAKNFNLSGFVDLNPKELVIEQYYFDLNARELNLAPLPGLFPGRLSTLPVQGKLDFNGTASGTLLAPKIDGQLALRNLAICSLTTENLTGNIAANPATGIGLNLSGTSDRININLSPSYQPRALQINLNNIAIAGKKQREIFLLEIARLPINIIKDFAPFAGINVPPALISQKLTGNLSTDLNLNLNTFAFSSDNLEITSPGIATNSGNKVSALSFDRITAAFRYNNGKFSLNNGTIQKKTTKYILEDTSIATTGNRKFQSNLTVQNGKIQNLIAILPIIESYSDNQATGTAADLYTEQTDLTPKSLPRCNSQTPPALCIPPAPEETSFEPTNPPLFNIGRPKASIMRRLRRFAEIQTFLARQQESQKNAILPPLEELRGQFDGSLTIAGAIDSGIQIDRSEFDFNGKNWQWGERENSKKIDLSQLNIKGSVFDNVLTILPLEIKYQAGTIALTSSIDFSNADTALDTVSGQLNLENISVAAIEKLIDLPEAIQLEGFLNATANIGGSIDNPIAKATLTIDNAKINQRSVETLEGNFDYNNNRNARLEFAINSILTESAKPAIVSGSIPYQLPFATVAPDNQQLSIQVDIPDKAPILLNILTRGQIAWIEGQGNVKLDISANLEPETFNLTQLNARGNINLIDSTIAAPELLPEAPLKNINSKILFDFDRLRVQNFKGSLASGGTIEIAGNLPLRDTNITSDRPLTVKLERLNLKFQQLYRGAVNGTVIVTGSLFEPTIGGNVTLSKGRVELAQTNSQAGNTQTENPTNQPALPIEFDNFKLDLDRDVAIVFSPTVNNVAIEIVPIVDFIATGTLIVNGSIAQIIPQGIIELKRGRINLFTTQFSLVKGYKNIARFSADRPLDPFLDVRLRTSVLESRRIAVPSDVFVTSEIIDNPNFNFGTLETVRIQARVRGYASQIEENLQLTSSPPRSETEIISLLGGTFVESLSRGGDPTIGLINLAGTAFFGTFQNDLARVLGLSELRIFPTQIIGEEEDDDSRNNQTLDLGVEAAIDITNRSSFSVEKILTAPAEPFRFGLRYRINQNLLLRGSTDLSGDNRLLIEYETRF